MTNPLDQPISGTRLPQLDDLDLSAPALTAADILPTPTPEQSDFMEAMKGSESIQLRAVAGSGKTTALKAGALMVPKGVALACAFNKSICDELVVAMPKWFTVKTMNGLGHAAWGRQIGRRLNLNKEKIYEIINAKWEWEQQQDFPDLKKLVDLARNMGIVPTGSKGLGKGLNDDEFVWQDLIEDYEIECPDGEMMAELVERARVVIRDSIERAWLGGIDFTDQLYMPTVFNAPFQRYPMVLVDEAQDLSGIQHTMLARSLSSGGRTIAVGDPHQAIYGFRGAHVNSMESLRHRFSARVMPLTVSFRCPQAVVQVAQRYVPEIQAFAGAPYGHTGPSDINTIKPGDAILSRFNKPLFQLAFKLIKKNLGPKILGRDIGAGLVRIVRRFGQVTIGEMTGPMLNWASAQIEMLRNRNKTAQAELLADKVECINVVAEQLGATATTDKLIESIQRLFDDNGGLVTLGTIHKMKGLEYPRVHFLGLEQLPPRWIKEGTWQHQQEINACYIGVTRAKKELYFLPEERR